MIEKKIKLKKGTEEEIDKAVNDFINEIYEDTVDELNETIDKVNKRIILNV